jgi:hypothetical protein
MKKSKSWSESNLERQLWHPASWFLIEILLTVMTTHAGLVETEFQTNMYPDDPERARAITSSIPCLQVNQQPVSITSIIDPWHFGKDPDPRIRTTDIRIRLWIRILLFTSVAAKMPKKLKLGVFFSKFLSLLLFEDTLYISGTDPQQCLYSVTTTLFSYSRSLTG